MPDTSDIPALASEWNAFLDREVKPLARGRLLHALVLDGAEWRHPWFTRVTWSAAARRWEALVRPGFVNGLDVTASVIGDDGALVDRPLTDAPFIPLTSGWRRIGADADPEVLSASADGTVTLSYEPVPDFFLARGVAAKPGATISADNPAAVLSGLEDSSVPSRRLRALDLVLHQERPGLGTDANGRPTLIVPDPARLRARIATAPRWTAGAQSDPQALLAGNWAQATQDSELICTVYMLSPEGRASGAPVDDTWTPFVKHKLFWNLNYAHNLPDFALARPLALQTGLAGGVADPVIQTILDDNNAQFQQAADFLATRQVEGRFWSV